MADVALPVGRRPRVLEHAVLRHGGHDTVHVVTGERLQEAAGRGQRRVSLRVLARTVVHVPLTEPSTKPAVSDQP
jgi:hypothetical protein